MDLFSPEIFQNLNDNKLVDILTSSHDDQKRLKENINPNKQLQDSLEGAQL